MPDYKPNSNKYKEQQKEAAMVEKRVDKRIKGTATVKKKSELRKFANNFISEDASNVKTYIFQDVLIPAAKKLISDIVRDGIDMILYGGTRSTDRFANGARSSSYVSYSSYSNRKEPTRPAAPSGQRFDYDDISFENRGDAEFLLDQMGHVLGRFNYVTVADMYDIARLPAPPYTATKFGWTNLRDAQVVRGMDGRYRVKLTGAYPID